MIWLILSILCSTLIMLVFKWADTYKVDRVQLIVVNYAVAFISGLLAFYPTEGLVFLVDKAWFCYAVVLGLVFIVCFNIIGYAIQQIGVGVITVANKMSLVIPVLFSLLVVGEQLTLYGGLGIAIALVAVYLSSVRSKGLPNHIHYWKLPLMVFIISGFVDTYIKYVQEYVIAPDEFGIFCTIVFCSAGIIGSPLFVLKQVKLNANRPMKYTLGFGLLLGLPNFGSIYFLMEALNSPGWESSRIFPLNHIGVVLLATSSGVLLFRESLNTKNKMGVVLALIAILLLSAHG